MTSSAALSWKAGRNRFEPYAFRRLFPSPRKAAAAITPRGCGSLEALDLSVSHLAHSPSVHRQRLRRICAPVPAVADLIDNSPVGSKREQNIVKKPHGRPAAPTTVNSSVRTREYLTTAEIERLMAAARKSSRYGHRDATMILIGYRHGLRASELCDLQWSQVELTTGRLHVRRAKKGSPSVDPMQGDEIRALRRLRREQGLSSQRDGPMMSHRGGQGHRAIEAAAHETPPVAREDLGQRSPPVAMA